MHLTVLDSLTLPGKADRPNEDAFGWTGTSAFVIDGATGLGEGFLVGHDDSDAAWLAAFAKVTFEETLDRGEPVPAIVASLCAQVRRFVDFAADGREIEPWAMPIASFGMARIETGRLVAHGLGDCTLWLQSSSGDLRHHCAMTEAAAREQAQARNAVGLAGGLSGGRVLAHATVLEGLRAARAAYNRPGAATWTLGPFADAGAHVASETLDADLPATGLLCSDGFAALALSYGRYDPASLIAAARRQGLDELGRELRRIECEEDPEGIRFPRFKPSDDATAVLFEIAA